MRPKAYRSKILYILFCEGALTFNDMPNVRLLPVFITKLRKFTKRNTDRSNSVKITLKQFETDPDHPSLHLEKLSGSTIWSIRIDQGNRMFFTWSDTGDTAIFFHVGSHDSYKQLN